jgi:glycosyltransferase involved in cell wall biosynthesis
MKRVLFISYAFPPTGGGGVQRSVKFVKYLPTFGWSPTVLTVSNPSTPVQDADLQNDLDPRLRIIKAKTLEPSYRVKAQFSNVRQNGFSVKTSLRSAFKRFALHFLQPDIQILWNRNAAREANDELRRFPYSLIYVTAPPFSSFLLGAQLKRRWNIPLVLDFRDEWSLASKYLENQQQGYLASRRQERMMRRTLMSADAAITTTKLSQMEIANVVKSLKSRSKVFCIHNGYDPEDIENISVDRPNNERLHIVYTGTLWRLTDISPFVRALALVSQISKEAAEHLRVTVAGRITNEQSSALDAVDTDRTKIVRRGYLPHRESIQLAQSADLLLLLLSSDAGSERVVPAKMFEYLAIRRPILAICPPGETADLLRPYSRVTLFSPKQERDIANFLVNQTLENRRAFAKTGASVSESTAPTYSDEMGQDFDDTERFSRRALTQQLATLFDGLTTATEN